MTSWNKARDAAVENNDLREALATQPVIEQAKGMLMVVQDCSSEEAFDVLRELSQHTNVKLRDVAAVIVATGSRSETVDELEAQTINTVLAELRRRIPGEAFS